MFHTLWIIPSTSEGVRMHFSRRQFCTTALSGTCALLAAPLHAREVAANAHFPDTISLDGKSLRLNGAGIRHKAMFDVYAAGMYADRPIATAEQFFANKGPRRFHVIVLRKIGQEFGNAMMKAVRANTDPQELQRQADNFLKMGSVFTSARVLNPGSYFTVDWLPSKKQTVIGFNGKAMETFNDPHFFEILADIWVGQRPVEASLKSALLGKEVADANPFKSGN